MDFDQNYRKLTRTLIVLFLTGIALLFFSRTMFYSQVVDPSELIGIETDIWRAFWVGLRFDAKVVAIGFAPLLLVGLILSSFSSIYKQFTRVIPSYSALIFFLLSGMSIANYYYYVTYGTYIDVFVFGLVDDDTEAVLENAWEDYPILRSFLTAIFVGLLGYVGSSKLIAYFENKSWSTRRWWQITVSVVAMIAITVVIARGSVGTLPLKRYHANVSQYAPLNNITPNAFMALDWAKSDYKKQSKFEPISKQELEQQMIKVLGQPNPIYKTPKNDYLESHQPHVVMALMEGLGNNVLVEDDPENNDLLGSLRKHFDEDFVFERFMAGTSATIDSIVMMLFHSDIPTISHSSAQRVELPSSAVLPYKQAGYDVVFIYGGNSMWRNLANYLPRQGFDTVYDENSIIKAFPEAKKEADTWGVPDEFIFKFARKLLDEADKPQMIYIMTVTNHSPFRAPSDYQAKPVRESERLKQLLGSMEEEANDLLQVYQYANDSLGQFITGVKASPLGKQTVIAASGDHRMRYLATDSKEEFGLTFGVPFYMYVPDEILEHTDYEYDESRIGSHRDVYPTLYHFSLSDQKYVSLGGENMLSQDGVSNIGYNNARTITNHGAFANANAEKLFPWRDEDSLFNLNSSVENPEQHWAQEYHQLQNYYLRYQVMADSESK
ncbi:sulfatase-like hydrolase/transferase [Vibrio sp. D420a]|uniref:LTA synthase family protein n=1 Tax=Vibrio sp. D420a TaxID=2836895 RepID=UPI002556EB11|nr:alkaline phosphatase family protein [Vibrio sp. D420a]MDK9762862.1 sulfatase-like hydrolase/transferase [Vibrio sp. D420a]